MDVVVLFILILLAMIFFRRFSNVIYVICIIDIFLRLVTKIFSLVSIDSISVIVNKLPVSILGIINNYSSGIINVILIWIYISIYIIFLGYIIRALFTKKRRRY